MSFGMGTKIAQEKMGVLAAANIMSLFNPQGDTYYVDSTNGNDGNDGESPRHALKTLARAIAVAAAGDNIVLNPGGSETLSAAQTISTADLHIICPVRNPARGYKLTAAGTLDILSITGSDCLLYGLQFAPTGTTHNQACVAASGAADRLTVINCLFDATAIVTTFTGKGVEIAGGCDDTVVQDCVFLDCQFGVDYIQSGTDNSLRPQVKGCKFYVGRTASFGINASPAGGNVRGLLVDSCHFIEGTGAGAAAAAAWDGTNGTNATQGPLQFSAACDQFVVTNCRAYTAASYNFTNIQAINAGAAGKLVDNSDGFAETSDAKADSVGLQCSTLDSRAVVISTGASTNLSTTQSAATLLSSAVSTADSKVVAKGDSVGTLVSTGNAAAVTASTAASTNQAKAESVGLLVSTGSSKVDSTGALSSTLTLNVSTGSSRTDSVGTQVSTVVANVGTVSGAVSTATVKIDSDGTLVSTAIANTGTVSGAVSTVTVNVGTVSGAVSTATVNVGTVSTAVSTVTVKVDSVGTNANTALVNIATLSTALSTVISHATA